MGYRDTTTSTFAVCGAAPASVFAACGAAPASTFAECGGIGPATILSLTPSIGAAGSAISVTIHGENFAPGATVQVSGIGVVVSAVVVVDAFNITATFTTDAGLAAADHDVTVTNP